MLGLAVGTTVVLISILGFTKYAINTPGVQTLGFIWGLANGMALMKIIPSIPGFGPWIDGIVSQIITPPVQLPDGWPQWLETWGGWVIAIGLLWLFVTRILMWHPRDYIAWNNQRAKGVGGGGGGGGRPNARQL